MKDVLEPFLYPHNLVLYGLLLACLCYRKKGLWILLTFYYLCGNTLVANQVRNWYASTTIQAVPKPLLAANADPRLYVVLGCGGSAQQLPACAAARLQQLHAELTAGDSMDKAAAVVITTRYCQPYIDYLQQRTKQVAIDCYDAGDNTYQEFASLAKRLDKTQNIRFITSDYHSWRVSKLLAEHEFIATVGAASTQTFRQVNCGLNCLFTVNLTNLDFYSKLVAEFSSYAVYRLGGERLTGTASE